MNQCKTYGAPLKSNKCNDCNSEIRTIELHTVFEKHWRHTCKCKIVNEKITSYGVGDCRPTKDIEILD
jgi:hypothetical protein